MTAAGKSQSKRDLFDWQFRLIDQQVSRQAEFQLRQREDKMGCSPRFWTLISSVAIMSSLALGVPGKPAFAADNQVVFIFGGDVEFSLNGRPPTVRYRVGDPMPYGRIVFGWGGVRGQ